MATINTRILLRYDTYENWSKTDVELKGGNFILKKGEVGFCEIPSDNTAATTAPTVLFKVGDGTNAFKDLKWASALAADVYSWAKENKITIVKNGTGNVVSNIEWDATANNGKGGIKFSTIDVYTKTESDNLYAKKKNANGGFEGGNGASATSGGAIGSYAVSESGGAVGDGATTNTGGAVGNSTRSAAGGAVGDGASTSDGFAGGKNAKTLDADNPTLPIDAIQLGTGTNNTPKSLQVYDYTLMNPDGSIPAERLTNAATPEELERLNYYGNKDIVPSDEGWFTVNAAGNTITGLTDTGKSQSGTLVIPYKINGKIITGLDGDDGHITYNILYGATDKFTKVILPNSITYIEAGAFSDCASLTSINIPNSITRIESSAFSNCTRLTSIEIPNSLGYIAARTFNGCTSLESIHIPNSINRIESDAFSNCTSLNKIEIPASVTYIDGQAFSGITPSQLTIYCEQGSDAETYAKQKGFNIIYTDVSDIATAKELERLQYYGDKSIVPSDERYDADLFTVNATGETITGLTEIGKMMFSGTLVIPYKINGTIITTLASDNSESILAGALDKFTKVILPNTITTIGMGAFDNCTSLQSIELSESLTSIDTMAFNGCTSLSSIKFPDSLIDIMGQSAFYNCTSLSSVILPSYLSSLNNGIFYGCTALEEIKIPDTVTYIGSSVFGNCTSLKKINLPESATLEDDTIFDGITPSQLTVYCEQGSAAETYAKPKGFNIVYTDIKKETINNLSSKEELERLNYYGDKNIVPADESYFTVNSTGETITGLTDAGKNLSGTLVIPYKINEIIITKLIGNINKNTSILDGATDKITEVILPNSIIDIGDCAFKNCTSLASINIPNSITNIGKYAFINCTSLSSITIPNSVTNIDVEAFQNCTSLTSIDIPNSVTNIGAQTFSDCSSLKSIKIPNSITNIGGYTFYRCTSLKTIEIPDSVITIKDTAFNFVLKLTVYCKQGSYAETFAKNNGYSIIYTDINSTYFNKYISKSGSNTISGTINATTGGILVSEPTSDTQAANKKYVDDSITAGIQANDAMTFKGLLGGEGNITELPTDIATVKNGETYKVAIDGTYNEIAAKSGDMFIALVKNSTVSWQFIPSADDGNVLANNDLTADALIVGNGSKEIKTLANGSNDQILRIVNNIPTWEKEYEVVATDTSITVTKDTENKQYKISVNSIDVNKLTQSEGTVLVLNGGNSAN